MTTIKPKLTQNRNRFHYSEPMCAWHLSNALIKHIPFGKQPVRFVCIGTDRSTGDSYGPLTGTLLTERPGFTYQTLGTLDDPLHALNLHRAAEVDKDVFTVAIDACLGKAENIGEIVIENRPLYPGKAVGKTLQPIGDISIKGVVNAAGSNNKDILQNTRLNLPFIMSRLTARAIYLASQQQKQASHRWQLEGQI